MPYTMVAWSQSAAKNGLTAVNALSDPGHVSSTGTKITVPAAATSLIGAYALGASVARAQLRSVSLRTKWGNYEVSPVVIAATPSATISDFPLNPSAPLALEPGEDLEAYVDNGNTIARDTLVALLSSDRIAPHSRAFFTARFTGTTTLTAFSWTNVALTSDDAIPSGRYDVLGMRVNSAGAIAARLVIPGQWERPGVIAATAADAGSAQGRFRAGRMGVLGTFDHKSVPSIDVLSSSADTTETILLDLAKVA